MAAKTNTKTTTTTTPKRKSAKGTNGHGKSWKPGSRVLLRNGNRAVGAGKGGTVKGHGVTTTGYQRGCRCGKCKAAMTEFNKARRAAKRAAAAK